MLVIGILVVMLLFMADSYEQSFKPKYIEEVNIDKLAAQYRTFHNDYPSIVVQKSSKPYKLEIDFQPLPKKVKLAYGEKTIEEWVEDFVITGLAVSSQGKLVFEDYYRGNSASSQSVAFSTTKSIVSALCGIAVDDGLIESIEDPIDKYVPLLVGSGYEGVSIKDILQMSSGVKFDEYDGSKDSEISKFIEALTEGSLDEYVASISKEGEAGKIWNYQSINTQALTMLLREVTNMGLNEYLQEKIWEPSGMEFDAYFRVDKYGVEMASGYFTWPLRDRVRFGLLYLNKGQLNDNQILSKEWVKASHTPDAEHISASEENLKMGYGYQFWLPLEDNGDGDYLAIGVRGQFIYINPKYESVIATSAAFPSDGADEYGLYVYQMIEVFRDISRHYSR